jgi:hypothetical protein
MCGSWHLKTRSCAPIGVGAVRLLVYTNIPRLGSMCNILQRWFTWHIRLLRSSMHYKYDIEIIRSGIVCCMGDTGSRTVGNLVAADLEHVAAI